MTPCSDDVLQEDVLEDLSSVTQIVSIHKDARRVLVHMITETITVRPNHDESIPIFRDQTSSDPVFFIKVDGIPGRTKQLNFTGSGNCRVIQFPEN